MVKAFRDLSDFKNVLPYASEIFGVYQPLLGWKSKRTLIRMAKGVTADRRASNNKLTARYNGTYTVALSPRDQHIERIQEIKLGHLGASQSRFELAILRAIASRLPAEDKLTEQAWKAALAEDAVLKDLNGPVLNELNALFLAPATMGTAVPSATTLPINPAARQNALKSRLERESITAALVVGLAKQQRFDELKATFYPASASLAALVKATQFNDPFDTMDPKKDLDRVGLSPIGIVHLFRQYFFEFDTFLGSPVGHVWLSPGSQVELIEISTRRTLTEKTVETETETTSKIETSTTDQDEISDAVKEDNKTDTKFGASVGSTQSWVWGSANESASFALGTTQETAREQTHKHMREQTEKLSTEIRQNYKATFKTVTEVTDTTSKRYTLSNNTPDLINYELRRKMRQVGVQVQDIGTYLCWQTYVDEPGKSLGVAEMIHVMEAPDFDQIPHPEEIVAQKPFTETVNIQVPFVGKDTDDNDQAYTRGAETEVGAVDSEEHIEWRFPQTVTCKEPNYYLDSISLQPQGADVQPSVADFTVNTASNTSTFIVQLDYVDFHEQDAVNIAATLNWKPNQDAAAIAKANKDNLAAYTARVESEYRAEFVAAAKDRVKLASLISPRSYEDLREEERIVVYRKLIQDLLAPENLIPQPDARTRHIVAELLNSIFDVDKMLYFVAPEWWRPRQHYGQSFGKLKASGKIGVDGTPEMVPDLTNHITDDNLVGWGGLQENRPDNYYITDESAPAKLGSSLGWLLQLDGDNLRNAFLNAPWVKAVIPIRPGKERAAINWLKQVEGLNGIGNSDMYTGTEAGLAGKTMLQVLEILADEVRAKHEKSLQTTDFPDPDNPTDTENTVSATPVDKVYEHGFYPLQGGFRANVGDDFEVFDQWIEVLPTDQVVAVQVKYDPKTGRQI